MAEYASLSIDGMDFEVLAVEGREALSELFRFAVVSKSGRDARGDTVRAHALIGRGARLTLRDGIGATRVIHGIVAEASTRVFEQGTVEVKVMIRPGAHALTLGRDSRVFHNTTVVEIAQQVLSRANVPLRLSIRETYARREYTAQYREDDWTFVSRLLEEEGIHTWFDHDGEASTLVLDDLSTSAPDLPGGASVLFAPESGMRADREVVKEFAGEVQATPTRFAVGSFDPARPALELAATDGEGPFEVYDAPGGGPRGPDACVRRARLMREAAHARRAGAAGVAESVRFVPGCALELGGHSVGRYDGRWLVTEATIEVVQRDGASKQEAPVCHFRAIRGGVPFRPAELTAVAKQAGLQSGVVIGGSGEEIFPDASGQVRVQLHWDREGARDDVSGKWMRVAQRGTADSMLLPRVGWNVLTHYEEGSVDAPGVLSRIHDAEHPPSYPLPANKTRVVFKTATTPGGGSFNEIHFEDKAGAQAMLLNASRDMNVVVNNDKSETIRRDSRRNVVHDHDLGITANHSESVVNDQSVTIHGSETLKIVGDKSRSIGGNESERIAPSRSLKTGLSHTDSVTATRSLDVGTALLDTTLGPIACSSGSSTNIMVGGAAVRVSAKSISETVKLATVQTIGGAKLELAKGSRTIAAKFAHVETVGGAMVLKTAGAYTSNASISSNLTAGALSVGAPEIVVTGKQKIVLTCGSSSVTITDSAITVNADKYDLSGAKMIKADAKSIDHNH